MADLTGFGFNAATEEPLGDFSPLPEGNYTAAVVESEMKENSAKTGEYLSLTFEILDGEYKGRRLWANLNLKHPNADAVRIARAELSSVCRAVNVMQPKDSSELHDIPLSIFVKLEKRKDTGESTNRIKKYEKQGLQPVAAVGGGKPPWQK